MVGDDRLHLSLANVDLRGEVLRITFCKRHGLEGMLGILRDGVCRSRVEDDLNFVRSAARAALQRTTRPPLDRDKEGIRLSNYHFRRARADFLQEPYDVAGPRTNGLDLHLERRLCLVHDLRKLAEVDGATIRENQFEKPSRISAQGENLEGVIVKWLSVEFQVRGHPAVLH